MRRLNCKLSTIQASLAERTRFELVDRIAPIVGLANRWFQPLTHLSIAVAGLCLSDCKVNTFFYFYQIFFNFSAFFLKTLPNNLSHTMSYSLFYMMFYSLSHPIPYKLPHTILYKQSHTVPQTLPCSMGTCANFGSVPAHVTNDLYP